MQLPVAARDAVGMCVQRHAEIRGVQNGEVGMCVQVHAESRVQQQVCKCRCLQSSELGIGNESAVACRG